MDGETLLAGVNADAARIIFDILENEPDKYKKWLRWADVDLKSLGPNIVSEFSNSESLLNEVIYKIIFGDRNPDLEKLPIDVIIYNTLRSVISNTRKLKQNQRYITIDADTDNNYSDEEELTEIADKNGIDNNSNGKEPDFLKEIENRQLIDLISKEIDNDYDCSILLEAMKEVDPNKNKELSETTGYSVEKVENVKKKFRRHCNKIVAKYKLKPY